MLLVADEIKESYLTVSPETLLIEIIKLIETLKEENRLPQELFVIDNSKMFVGLSRHFLNSKAEN